MLKAICLFVAIIEYFYYLLTAWLLYVGRMADFLRKHIYLVQAVN